MTIRTLEKIHELLRLDKERAEAQHEYDKERFKEFCAKNEIDDWGKNLTAETREGYEVLRKRREDSRHAASEARMALEEFRQQEW